jgi:MFS family permease
LRTLSPRHGGLYGSIATVSGLALLVVGTSTNSWPLIVAATLLVGGGAGVASAAAFGIAGRVGIGQRTRIFARMYLVMYSGYSLPALAIGLIALHASFESAFIIVTIALALIAAALPLLRDGEAGAKVRSERALAA